MTVRYLALLLPLLLFACGPRPGPLRQYTCDVPDPMWRVECPRDAFVDVVLATPDQMEEFRRVWRPDLREVRAYTLPTQPHAYTVVMHEHYASLRLFAHEIRCHVRAYLDGEASGGWPHRAIDGWDCEAD